MSLFSYYYESGDELALVYSSLVSLITGALMFFSFVRQDQNIRKREGFLIVLFKLDFLCPCMECSLIF